MDRLWAPGAVVTTGGFTRESGLKTAEETGRIIGYGVLFTANVRLSPSHSHTDVAELLMCGCMRPF